MRAEAPAICGIVRAGSAGSNTSAVLAGSSVARPFRREGRRRSRSGRARPHWHSSWRSRSCRSAPEAATSRPPRGFRVAQRNPRLARRCPRGSASSSRARRAAARRPSNVWMMSSHFPSIRSDPNSHRLSKARPAVNRRSSAALSRSPPCAAAPSRKAPCACSLGGLASSCSTARADAAGIERADHRLDRADRGRSDRELLDPEPDQRHRLQRPARPSRRTPAPALRPSRPAR